MSWILDRETSSIPESPSSQKAGQIPALLLLSPIRILACTFVRRPGAGVNVSLLSIRPDVQPPSADGSFHGTSCTLSPPESCRFFLDAEYLSSSLLPFVFPSVTLQSAWFTPPPAAPWNLSCQIIFMPGLLGGSVPQTRAERPVAMENIVSRILPGELVCYSQRPTASEQEQDSPAETV